MKAACATSATLALALGSSCGRMVSIDPTPAPARAGTGGAVGTPSTPATSLTNPPSSATGVTSSSSTVSSTTAATSSGMSCPPLPAQAGPCTPPGCPYAGTPCFAASAAQGAQVFTLRIAHLTVARPASMVSGVLGQVLHSAITPEVHACNLHGAATASWLLRFDLPNGALTTGGAKPAQTASGPYAFVDEHVTFGSSTFHIAPAAASAPFTDCAIDSSPIPEVLLPMYLDHGGASIVLLSLHAVRFGGGTFSNDHRCIGSFDAAGLDPSAGCMPDAQHPLFSDGGGVTGSFVLAEADRIDVAPTGQSLCVLLSGDASQYGDGGHPIVRCKKAANSDFVFQGDWCAATDEAATATCHDALRFAATFAASRVDLQ
jgi:hypothetical protein